MEKPLSKMHVLLIILASIAGLALTILATNNSMNAIKTKSWPTTQGTVITSEVIRSSKYVPKVIYTYDIDTNAFSSDKIDLTNYAHYKYKDDAAKEADKYPVDAKVTVYYNPDKHNEAILEPGIKGQHIFMFLIGLVIFVAPLLGLIYSIRKTKESI
jgi:hypothetical protein